jgi:hypothetical protein
MVAASDGPLSAGLGGGGTAVCVSAGALSRTAKHTTYTTRAILFINSLLIEVLVAAAALRWRRLRDYFAY